MDYEKAYNQLVDKFAQFLLQIDYTPWGPRSSQAIPPSEVLDKMVEFAAVDPLWIEQDLPYETRDEKIYWCLAQDFGYWRGDK